MIHFPSCEKYDSPARLNMASSVICTAFRMYFASVSGPPDATGFDCGVLVR